MYPTFIWAHYFQKQHQIKIDYKPHEQSPYPLYQYKKLIPGGEYLIGSFMNTEEVLAPGWPGIPARWTSSAKSGVGTSVNVASKVTFTISHGIINEIYYPQVDKACTRDMEMIVTNGKDFFSEEKRNTKNQLEYIATGVPAYKLINTCHEGNYRIEKEILVDPMRDTLLQQVLFSPLKNNLKDYNLYLLLAPHLGNYGSGNTAWLGDYKGIPMLFAERNNIALALACSIPWKNCSVGFVGSSDGWQDLMQHKQMTWKFLRAENGNVALTAEINLQEMKDSVFTLALGFGLNPEEAGQRARASLFEGFDTAKKRYIEEWKGWQKKLYALNNTANTKKNSSYNLYRISTSVLRIHESKRHPGGFIASLSIPWGFSKGDDDLGGYHLVWPRDMVQTAGGLLAAKAGNDARRVLNYLVTTQEADGHWSQNMWLNGVPYRSGIQMDQTAWPILLVDLANREGVLEKGDLHQLWPMVRKAAEYMICNGPSTPQERWEENSGYAPYTLAVEIAALLIAADIADLNNHPETGNYLRETADAWNASIERWTYVTNTDLARKVGVEGYYVRISHTESDESSSETDLITIINRPPGENIGSVKEMISPDALALVRFGLRDPEDPRILNTVKVIDALLKAETPSGPCWYRYNGDGYGEHADGSPYDGTGVGRPWPLLTGERAHYEIAAGRFENAKKLLKTLESFANEGGMIPEQIWDKDDIPDLELFFGKPSGAAMPLVWAHAEYIKLCRSLKEKEVFDMPPQTKQRYLVKKKESSHFIWNFNNQCRFIPSGKILRIETLAPAIIRWTNNNWQTTMETHTKNTEMGIHFADLPAKELSAGTGIVFTFYWKDADKWENVDFSIKVKKEKHLIPA